LLPYRVRGNDFARTSDDALMGENKLSRGAMTPALRSTELYQLGNNHFIETHDVQLRYVLWCWMEMVEKGVWEVDENSGTGGMEKWMEANTKESWQKYQLSMSW